MPRRPRIQLNGVPLHIVQRGHNREPCFFSEEDYTGYLHWLGEALSDNECQLHAYALMTNHVHLLLTPKKAEAVPRLIMSLGRRYVQHINRTYKRTGTLRDSRYKSTVIQADTYLLICQRYIEITLTAQGYSTTVTQAMYGPCPFISKLMGLVFSMEKMVGDKYEEWLASLKAIAETRIRTNSSTGAPLRAFLLRKARQLSICMIYPFDAQVHRVSA